MKYNISKNIIRIVIIILIAIVSLGVWIYIYYKIIDEREILSVYYDELTLSSNEGKNFQVLKKFIIETSEDRDIIDSIFIKNDEESIKLFNEIENLGNVVGISTEIISVKDEKSTAYNQDILTINIKTEGSFENTIYFLKQLEILEYKLEINNSTLRITGEKEGNYIWSGRFTTNILSYIKN